MREVQSRQFKVGQTPIEKIWIDSKSRDDTPVLLKGLQHIWCERELRDRVFDLLDEHVSPETDRAVGRPGMDLWRILVLGVVKQGLRCDFDRLTTRQPSRDGVGVPGARRVRGQDLLLT